MHRKLGYLKAYIQDLGSLAVGFSGGVDSAFLLAVASDVLGDKCIAVTGVDASVPPRELTEAKEFCEKRGIRQLIRSVDPMKEEGYRFNSPDRCYFCKHCLFTEGRKAAEECGIEYIAEGSNMDDLGDYRPGLRAVSDLGVVSPLRKAGLHKDEIRQLSKEMNLPTWEKPAFACLASRFAYGEEITIEMLQMIDRAEQFLVDHGFRQQRVRVHGKLARIEVSSEEIARLVAPELREKVYEEFLKIGFQFVSVDLRGYHSGSMNITLPSDVE